MEREKKTKVEVFGELALDVGKLALGGIVLAGVFESDANRTSLIFGGLVFCAVIMVTGVFLVTKSDKKNKP